MVLAERCLPQFHRNNDLAGSHSVVICMEDTDGAQNHFDGGSLGEMLGPPVEVNEQILREAETANGYDELAFDLYREAAMLVFVASQVVPTQSDGRALLPRDQAACVGLLVRISKFMNVILQLSQIGDRREIVLSLNRSLLESAVNLKVLSAADPALFDEFVRSALGPEKELLDTTKANIAERGGEAWPIEKRMQRSLERIFRLSNVVSSTIDKRHRDWGGTFRERLRSIDEEAFYLYIQRIPSHAVHGTWVDLLLHHLTEKGDGFLPDPDWKSIDARILLPEATYVLESLRAYLQRFWASYEEMTSAMARLESLSERIAVTDAAHERFIGS